MVRVHLPEPHALDVRDLWDSITSAVGGAFNDDKTTSTKSSSTAKDAKTTAKTVLTTETPKVTKTTAQAADKTTATPKKTAATTSSSSKEDEKTTSKAAPKATSAADATTSAATAKATNKATTSTAATARATTSAASAETLLTLDTGTPTTSTSVSATAATATVSPTASAAAASTGTSAAAKAGIAIGVVAGVFFVVTAVFLLFRRRQKQQQQRRIADDEKNGPFADSAAIPGSRPKPAGSRLSLRPVTQLFTTGTAVALGGAGAAPPAGAGAAAAGANYPNRRQSRGGLNGSSNTIPLQNQAPMGSRGPYSNMSRVPGGAAAWGERPSTSQSSSNPFGDGAQRLGPGPGPGANGPARPSGPGNGPNGPSGPGNYGPNGPNGPNGNPNGNYNYNGPNTAPAAGAAAANLTRKASIRKDGPQALDLTLAAPRGININSADANGLGPVPPSPSGTEYSMNSMAPGQSTSPIAMGAGSAAIAAAGGPAVSAVHRVQLDFKPTLEDELGLRAGQLVRLLHEYDDGWALCIRLDRSQQGVVPRTCLSTRPVKPRPPPNGAPGSRPGPPVNPNNNNGRPMTPQGRPMGPNGRAPGQARPQSPQGAAPRMMAAPASSPLYNELPASASPASATSSKAPSLPPMSFGELPAFNATPSDASRSPSPSSPVEMPAAEMPAYGIATSVPAPASAGSPTSFTPGQARVRPVNSIGRKPVPGQAL